MQVLVEATTPDGLHHSVLLQNAETVRLVSPTTDTATATASLDNKGGAAEESASAPDRRRRSDDGEAGRCADNGEAGRCAEERHGDGRAPPLAWRTISVSQLGRGDELLVLQQAGARHTGISITEFIDER